MRVTKRRLVAVALSSLGTALVVLPTGHNALPSTAMGVISAQASTPTPLIWPPKNLGGGEVNVKVTFTTPLPVFDPLLRCGATAFSYDGNLTGAVANSVGTQFLGLVHITGGGSDNIPAGTGCATEAEEIIPSPFHVDPFDVTYQIGQVGSSRVACPTGLAGSYLRVGLHVVISLAGPCAINGTDAGQVTFLSTGEFAPGIPAEVTPVPSPVPSLYPTGGGDGGNTPIVSGVFEGTWSMLLQS